MKSNLTFHDKNGSESTAGFNVLNTHIDDNMLSASQAESMGLTSFDDSKDLVDEVDDIKYSL